VQCKRHIEAYPRGGHRQSPTTTQVSIHAKHNKRSLPLEYPDNTTCVRYLTRHLTERGQLPAKHGSRGLASVCSSNHRKVA
jgi:hypothetical protein